MKPLTKEQAERIIAAIEREALKVSSYTDPRDILAHKYGWLKGAFEKVLMNGPEKYIEKYLNK